MKNLSKEFDFLHSIAPNNLEGIAITTTPKKSFFQKLSLIFNKKAFDTEISFFLLGKEEIKIAHFLNGVLNKSIEHPLDKIKNIYISKGITEEGNINTLKAELEIITKVNKDQTVQTKSVNYTLLPAFLGENAERINSPETLIWAKEQLKKIEEKIKSINQ